jgi:CRP-like cAMP-binding protein
MAKSNVTANLKIAEKIPFFRGLSPHQVQQVLHAGQMISHEPGKRLCKNGENSREMFILLAGELVIKSETTDLAEIKPVEIVGEMGVVTNQPRSATIEVSQEATFLSITKIQFDILMKNDIDMAVKIYRNLLESLCQKLRDNNVRLSANTVESAREIAASVA